MTPKELLALGAGLQTLKMRLATGYKYQSKEFLKEKKKEAKG